MRLCARLHFDKHKRIVVACDDVDFTATAAAKITVENLVTVPAQKPSGQLLAERAPAKVFRRQ